MLQSVLETLPSFLLPRGAVRSSCDVSTMTCANNLTMDAQVMVGREERSVGRRTGKGLLPHPADSWDLTKLAAKTELELSPPDPILFCKSYIAWFPFLLDGKGALSSGASFHPSHLV